MEAVRADGVLEGRSLEEVKISSFTAILQRYFKAAITGSQQGL